MVAKSLNHWEQSRYAIRTEIGNRIKTTAITTTKILSFIFAGILFFSSIENANMTTHAQLSSYITNNSTFPNNGSDTDKSPGFLDAYWTNYLSSASSTSNNNNSVKKEVGPGDGASTLAVVLVNRGRSISLELRAISLFLLLGLNRFLVKIMGRLNLWQVLILLLKQEVHLFFISI